jgi:uncharacterized damage-inducible protein DinB
MSKLEMVRGLYDYNEWANEVILEACGPLDEEALRGKQAISHGSIATLLVHILGAQVLWLGRSKGEQVPSFPQLAEGRALDALRDQFAAYHAQQREFLGVGDDARLEEDIPMPEWADGLKGVSLPMWQVMMQVIEHGIHHRAEIQSALTGLGHPVRDLDYIFFEIERKTAR